MGPFPLVSPRSVLGGILGEVFFSSIGLQKTQGIRVPSLGYPFTLWTTVFHSLDPFSALT